MSFIHVKGPANSEPFPKLASTLIAAGAVVAFKGGYVSQALVQSVRIAGITLRTIAAADDDYASATSIPVIIPGAEDIFEATVSGTATIASHLGRQFDLTTVGAGTAQAVNLSGTTYKIVTVVGIISTSKVLVKFNGNYVYANKAN